MNDFSPVSASIGGIFIGLAASLFLLAHGRVAGVSGHLGSIVRGSSNERGLRLSFLAGLLVMGVVFRIAWPSVFVSSWVPSWSLASLAGVVVGFGTQLGNGCTSGHGVCGVSRLAPRSLAATFTFMITGILTTFLVRHVFGGVS